MKYIKQRLYEGFYDANLPIRRIVGTLITSIVCKQGFQNWVQLLEFLIKNLDGTDLNTIENSINVIA